jgi:lipid A ethanolaminephosphotransferase
VALLAATFFALAANHRFWTSLRSTQSSSPVELWLFLAGTAVALISVTWLLFLLVLNRWTVKPFLTVLFLATALAAYFMDRHGVYLDKAMLRNLVETDVREASELLEWRMLPHLLLLGVLPAGLLWFVRLRLVGPRAAATGRLTSLALASALALGSLWLVSPTLVPLAREHKNLRNLVAPHNYLVSLGRVLLARAGTTGRAREAVGADAHVSHVPGARPTALVLVVGETVRAANWGLDGYRRQTTPELARRGVVNFADVSSCGTDTATSLPCMFSVLGRSSYDEKRIRNSDSVLHILHRAGVSVLWRDNQSGGKGVADGLPFEDQTRVDDPSLVSPSGGRFDEVLLKGLKERIDSSRGDVLIVLHMLGNHGPAYFERYPPAFRRWQPTCDSTQLSDCSREALVNTYDNAILYTDHVLGRAIELLAGIEGRDTGLIYVSDHGESLGEHNFYLHGLPYVIAPREQTAVPMVMWLSPGLREKAGVANDCLAARAVRPASHDDLSHTLLGLMGIETAVYEPAHDLTASCRRALVARPEGDGGKARPSPASPHRQGGA